MFTGIIECVGIIEVIENEGLNKIFKINSPISHELKIDQSVAHDGVCLTVIKIENNSHWVVAIDETLSKTTLNQWAKGDEINLERCLKLGDRLDGHWVQGHVDAAGVCIEINDMNGSYIYSIEYNNAEAYRTVKKGSITINGTSLTVVDSGPGCFSVAIIPYTFEHTTFKGIKSGSLVNLEFDILGKWVKEWMK